MTVEVCSECDISDCSHIRARRGEPVAWYIDTHGVASVALNRVDLGLLHSRYARPLVFGDVRATLPESPAPIPAAAGGDVPVAPEGWRMVPVEPTDDMEAAAEDDYEANGETFPDWKSKWRAMLTAAPAPPGQDTGEAT